MSASPARDRYALYEASTQEIHHDLQFIERVARQRGRVLRDLREDFCGTAWLASAWVARGAKRRALGVDLDPEPLAWARRRHLADLGAAAKRVRLIRADVRSVTRPRVDAIVAMNFSWWVFHERRELLRYFRVARRSLRSGGLFFASAFGGLEAMGELIERRRIPASVAAGGIPLPSFTYEWEHESFNPVDHRLRCSIHYRFRDGSRMRRAFHYDWRMWTLPEIRDAMREAGFGWIGVYVQGWNDARNQPDATYRRRARFTNQEGWLAIVVGEA
jgi:SAM-dependent methyltransferase